MQLLSIRTLNVLLVVSCVVVVGTLCTTLTIISATRAVDDTRTSRDESVDSAFAVGEESVLSVTEQYLKQVGSGAKNQVSSFFSVTFNYLKALCTELNSADPAVIETWPYIYSKRAMLWNAVDQFYEMEALAIATNKRQYIGVGEGSATLTRGPDEYHHYWITVLNGTEFDAEGGGPAATRAVSGTSIEHGTGNVYGLWTNRSNEGTRCHPYMPSVLSDGKIIEAPCKYQLGDPIPANYGAHYGIFPVNQVYYSGIVTFATYMVTIARCEYQNKATGERLGMTLTATDLRKISKFLVSMDLGQDQGSLGRVFLVVRSAYFSEAGLLAGASHGSQFGWTVDSYFGRPMNRSIGITPSNSTDMYVSGAGTILEKNVTVNGTEMSMYEQLYLQKRTETIRLLANRSGLFREEDFYVRVDALDNGHGLNWYVVALVDREHVLGRVEREVASTRRRVAQNEAAVSDDLEKSRRVLYVVVVFCALVPLLLTVLFVFRVTKPLMRLMDDMSHVAVMNLEAVDANRPLSVLSEVRGMETSFKQMLRNLIEYRQYLPQSVLIESVSEIDESADGVETHRLTSARSGSVTSTDRKRHHDGASSSLSLTQSREAHSLQKVGVFDATLHKKSVTLLVSNLRDINTLRDCSRMAVVVASYLEPIVQKARKHRGIVDDVCGDRVTVSFNTTITAASHKVRAVELGSFLLDQWDQEANVAACTGSAVCGNMGCQGLKKYGVIGSVASNVRAVECCGRSWGTRFLCDGVIAADLGGHYSSRKVAKARMKDGKTSELHEVVDKVEADNDEWMYQLESNQTGNLINDTIDCIYAGDLPEAQKHFTEYGKGCSTTQTLLQYLVQTGRAPEVINLFAPIPLTPPVGGATPGQFL